MHDMFSQGAAMSGDVQDLLGIDPDHPDFVAGYEQAEQYERLIDSLVSVRKRRNLRQQDIADAMGTRQSVISDLERLGGDARFSTLQRYARAVGARLHCAAFIDGDVLGSGWRRYTTASQTFAVVDDEAEDVVVVQPVFKEAR